MSIRSILRRGLAAIAVIVAACPSAFAALHVTLRNGSEFLCLRREPAGDLVRLYLYPTTPTAATATSDDANYVEVPAASVLSVEVVPDPLPPAAPAAPQAGAPSFRAAEGGASPAAPASTTPLTPAQLHDLLARAGQIHDVDVDLLASVMHAESAGNVRAVSRAGAQGLMQLMPSTAADLGVHNSFAPDQNISGGTAYLDQLLTRYHNDMKLAVAAYNAGPAAVDRYRGIPPYAETRAYVARVIAEFNRRKLAARSTSPSPLHASN